MKWCNVHQMACEDVYFDELEEDNYCYRDCNCCAECEDREE